MTALWPMGGGDRGGKGRREKKGVATETGEYSRATPRPSLFLLRNNSGSLARAVPATQSTPVPPYPGESTTARHRFRPPEDPRLAAIEIVHQQSRKRKKACEWQASGESLAPAHQRM